jgi:hypothetical protein
MQINFLDRFFLKSSSTKFNEKPSSGSKVVPGGGRQTDMDDAANSRFSQFCERTWRRKATDNIMYCDTAVQCDCDWGHSAPSHRQLSLSSCNHSYQLLRQLPQCQRRVNDSAPSNIDVWKSNSESPWKLWKKHLICLKVVPARCLTSIIFLLLYVHRYFVS